MYGGRGSGKSYNAALMSAVLGMGEPLRILCVREFQVSIRESMYAEIVRVINRYPDLKAFYTVGKDFIRGANGTEYIFKGLRRNIENVKSMSGIDLCIVEEAENIPHESWEALLPTIRDDKSEMWIIFNPRSKDSWVAKKFIINVNKPPRTRIAQVNYNDNPWFSDVLEEMRKYDREVMDPANYAHVWEGAFYEVSDAVIFRGKFIVSDEEPLIGEVYYGLDFGFSTSPTAANRVMITDNRDLYVTHELNALELGLDSTVGALMSALPGVEEYIMRADNARPESINHLKKNGLPRVIPCEKGKGSIKDGIAHMMSFRNIYIHPRCKYTIQNFNLYSYRRDKYSGDVTPDIIDAYNDHIDAIRYALEGTMRKKSGFFQ